MTQRWKAGSDKKANANVKSKVGEREGQVGEIVTKKKQTRSRQSKGKWPQSGGGASKTQTQTRGEETSWIFRIEFTSKRSQDVSSKNTTRRPQIET